MSKDDWVYVRHMLDQVDMRHKLVHDYVHVDYDLVWETVTRHLSPLRAALVEMIEAEEETAGMD